MKCLRCGHCCLVSLVVIVEDPKLGPVEDNLKAINGMKERCPHLRGDEVGEYSCVIHDYPWYSETPCSQHGQVESSPDCECRMGRYLLDKLKSERVVPEAIVKKRIV